MKDVMVAFKTGSVMSKKAIVISKSVGDTEKSDFVELTPFPFSGSIVEIGQSRQWRLDYFAYRTR